MKKIFISVPAAQARDIAEILRAASQIPHTRIDVGLGFDSPAQAGQYQRRIKEAMTEVHLDPEAFSFHRQKDSCALDIVYVDLQDDSIPHDEPELTPALLERAFVPPPAPKTTESSSFTEGKAVLQSLTVMENAGGSYVIPRFLVVEGSAKGEDFSDSIRRFPPQGRLQRFADAFGATIDDLVTKPPSFFGTPVWFRRRTITLADGTTRTETFYYRVAVSTYSHSAAAH